LLGFIEFIEFVEFVGLEWTGTEHIELGRLVMSQPKKPNKLSER